MKLFLCLALLVAVALAAPHEKMVKRDDSAAAASAAANAATSTIVQIQNGPPGGYNGAGYNGGGYNGAGYNGGGPNGGETEAQRDAFIQAGSQKVIQDAARPFQSALTILKGFASG